MDKKTWIVIGVIVLALGGLVGISLAQSGPANRVVPVEVQTSELAQIIPADERSGNLPENVEGDPNAPVKIFEYADYQCEGCASVNPRLNKLVEEYGGKVAVIYRGFVQDYHQNGTAAASAANAAAIQGYWKAYKDQLFTNQMDWFFSSASKRQQQFEDYFVAATEGKGDLEKFRKDMKSVAVAQKISFDRALCEKRNLEYTPLLYIGDEQVDKKEMDIDSLRKLIDAKLKELGEK